MIGHEMPFLDLRLLGHHALADDKSRSRVLELIIIDKVGPNARFRLTVQAQLVAAGDLDSECEG
jgi:hypothetical protein